jgi:uncharacterized membrane protein YciS (DUF1049 family)
MKYKIDKILGHIWLSILPLLIVSFVLSTAIELFITLNDELGAMYFNIVCLLSIMLGIGWVINLIWALISLVQEKLHSRYLDKHPEKCVSTEQLARDFENLAQALRDSEKEKEEKEIK